MVHAFSIALIAGVIVGTYSLLYVAGSAPLALGISGRGDLETDSGAKKSRGARRRHK